MTRWKTAEDFQPTTTKLGSYAGRYIRYGVREHGMGAIMNGLAAYGKGLVIPAGGTFLNFVSCEFSSLAFSMQIMAGRHSRARNQKYIENPVTDFLSLFLSLLVFFRWCRCRKTRCSVPPESPLDRYPRLRKC